MGSELSNEQRRGFIRRLSGIRWFPVDILIFLEPRESEVYKDAVLVRWSIAKLIKSIEATITYSGRRISHTIPIDNQRAKIISEKMDAAEPDLSEYRAKALKDAESRDAFPFNKHKK